MPPSDDIRADGKIRQPVQDAENARFERMEFSIQKPRSVVYVFYKTDPVGISTV